MAANSEIIKSKIEELKQTGFTAMGFKRDKGANFSRTYSVNTIQEIDKLVQDIERIFRELFRTDDYAQIEVTDVE